MVKSMFALVAFFVLAFASTANAYLIVGPQYVVSQASLTKVGENTYDFTYSCGLDERAILDTFYPYHYDPLTGENYYYYPDFNYARSGASGEFGIPTNLSENSVDVGPNFYNNGGSGTPYSAWFGSFRITQAPGVISMWTTSGIIQEVYSGGGGYNRMAWDTVEGRAKLYGDIPTSIGQTTTWSITPEPPTGLLGAVLLAGFYFARRKSSRLRPT